MMSPNMIVKASSNFWLAIEAANRSYARSEGFEMSAFNRERRLIQNQAPHICSKRRFE